jgi:hypothetical protein
MNNDVSAFAGANFTFLGMDSRQWTFLIALLALNLFVLWALRRITLAITLTEVLAEKDPAVVRARAVSVDSAVEARAAMAAEIKAARSRDGETKAEAEAPAIPDPVPTSSSRTAAFLGSLVLVAALWAFANYSVWAAFWDPAAIGKSLDAFKSFFLAGAALFAPYAFNQLGTAFRRD